MRKAFGRRDREEIPSDADADRRPAAAGAGPGGPSSGERNPGRGLHGSLDSPRDLVTTPGSVTVGGWVFHEDLAVRHVVVTFDDLPVGLALPDEARPDVHAAHPGHSSAALAGWTVEIPRQAHFGPHVRVGAYALLDTGKGGPTRLGTLVRFGENTVPTSRSAAEFGQITPIDSVPPGYVDVSGTARHPAGLSRVEVSVAGGPPVRARHSLPGRVSGSTDPDEADLAGFSAFVQVPEGVTSVELAVTVVGSDERAVSLAPLEVPVVPPSGTASFTAARSEVLAGRLARQVEALAGSAQGPPRVLVATHDLCIGGAQLYLHLLVRGLRERGIDLCLVSGGGGVLLDELERDLDVPVLVVGQAPPDRERLESLRLQIAGFAAAHHVVGCVANTLLAFPAVSAAQQMGLPTMWAIHESFDPASFWRQYFGYALPTAVSEVALDALARCDEVIFEAEATRRLYGSLVDQATSTVVPYGVDTTSIDAFVASHTQADVRAALSLPPDARVLVCVGTVEPRKGQLALVRAFGRLPQELRAGAVLVLVGAGQDPYSRAVRDHVVAAGLDEVRVVDVDADIHRWYLAADVLVSASDIESVPRTMLEAMAMRRPVAATDVFGVGEIVVEGETGFTCAALDLSELTDLLRRAIEAEAELLERLGQAAREVVLQRHDPGGYTTHYADPLSRWLTDRGW